MRWDIINRHLLRSRARRFLEIGIGDGSCAARVEAHLKWGVDPRPKPGAERSYDRVFQQTSDEYFARQSEKFDVVLIDGLHHADQVYRDILHALAVVSPRGVVVAHDCNPSSEAMQAVPQRQGIWTGDCWRAIVRLRASRPLLTAYVINTDFGVGVIRKRSSPLLKLDKAFDKYTYADLRRDRKRLLDLREPK